MFILRWILFPFALLYGLIVELRNSAYDLNLFSVYAIPVKSIVVGNLSTGGTGKTPHVHYLADFLRQNHKVCIVSRGYGRSTTGFKWVEQSNSATEVGDEPLFYKRSFGADVLVAVGENRTEAIQDVLKKAPATSVFLLDDAYQHRAVQCGLSILLTEYNQPFFKDQMLPTGNLREFAKNKKRADVLIVTKCPEGLSENEKERFRQKLNVGDMPVFFSSIVYGEPVAFGIHQWLSPEKVLLITGIANPNPLLEYVSGSTETELMDFPDHHDFTATEIERIHRKFDTFADVNAAILTTEKDFVRLGRFLVNGEMNSYPWFYLPITVQIDNEEKFKSIVNQYVGSI